MCMNVKIACAYLFENERKNEFEEKIRKKIHILFKNNVEFDCWSIKSFTQYNFFYPGADFGAAVLFHRCS